MKKYHNPKIAWGTSLFLLAFAPIAGVIWPEQDGLVIGLFFAGLVLGILGILIQRDSLRHQEDYSCGYPAPKRPDEEVELPTTDHPMSALSSSKQTE